MVEPKINGLIRCRWVRPVASSLDIWDHRSCIEGRHLQVRLSYSGLKHAGQSPDGRYSVGHNLVAVTCLSCPYLPHLRLVSPQFKDVLEANLVYIWWWARKIYKISFLVFATDYGKHDFTLLRKVNCTAAATAQSITWKSFKPTSNVCVCVVIY